VCTAGHDVAVPRLCFGGVRDRVKHEMHAGDRGSEVLASVIYDTGSTERFDKFGIAGGAGGAHVHTEHMRAVLHGEGAEAPRASLHKALELLRASVVVTLLLFLLLIALAVRALPVDGVDALEGGEGNKRKRGRVYE